MLILDYLCGCMTGLSQSCPTLCNPMDEASRSMELSRQEYWSELPFPSPRDLPDPVIKLESLVSPALASGFFINEPPGKLYKTLISEIKEEPNK